MNGPIVPGVSNGVDQRKDQLYRMFQRDTKRHKMELINERTNCTGCFKKRMFFCYDCRRYMPGIAQLAPVVQLPVNVDIIKHSGEKNGKSTAIHAALLAPDSVRLFDAPDFPDYGDANDTVLVYPDPGAMSMTTFLHENAQIRRMVFIDGTWSQAPRLREDSRLASLPCVCLQRRKTEYWRPQKGLSDDYLATIEAVYYAVVEYSEIMSRSSSCDVRLDQLDQSTRSPSYDVRLDQSTRSSSYDVRLDQLDQLDQSTRSSSYDVRLDQLDPLEQSTRSSSHDVRLDQLDQSTRSSSYDIRLDQLLFWFRFFGQKVSAQAEDLGRIK